MKEFKIAGIGEILWDVFPDGKRLGGAPANFAFHAGQMGANSCIISRVGADKEGEQIRRLLNEKKIPNILQVDPVFPTGKVTVKTDDQGFPDYIIHENSAWDNIVASNDIKKITATLDAICFGSLAQRNSVSKTAIREIIRSAGKRCLKIFDINLRQNYYSSKDLASSMEMTDILKLNHEELEVVKRYFLTGRSETELLNDLKTKFSLKAVILTKGAEGSRIFKDIDSDCTFKSHPVEVADSVGAGDSFTAAAVMGFLKKFDLEKINMTASQVAAYVCTQKGATPSLPQSLMDIFLSKKT